MTLIDKIKIIIPLFMLSIITFTVSYFYDYNGILVNFTTEIIGIIVAIAYVEYRIEQNKKNEWKRVTSLLKNEIYYISNTIVSSFRTVFGINPDDFFGYKQMINFIDMNESETARRILELYNLKISKGIKYYLTNMNENSWKNLIIELSDLQSAAINFQSMYNSISSPKQIEMIMTIRNEIKYIINKLQLVPEFYIMSDEEFSATYDDEKIEMKKALQEQLGTQINNIINILYNAVIEFEK